MSRVASLPTSRALSVAAALAVLGLGPTRAGSLASASPATAASEEVGGLRARYPDAVARLARERAHLAHRLRSARGRKARGEVLEESRRVLIEALWSELLPAWYGTPWEFYGTSDTPGVGAIACGHFVGTVLAHAGFEVDRLALGRLASEHIGLSLTHPRNLRRWSGRPASEVEAAILAWGPGLYVVGLDQHAGLILVRPDSGAWFIHSTAVGDAVVLSEPLQGPNPFAWSRYRVVARLLDDEMMSRWLRGTRVKLVTE